MIKTELTNAVSTLGALQGLRLFLAVRKDPLRGFCDLQQKYGDFIRWKGPYTTYQLTHPADVQHVLQTNPGNYHKGRNYRISREYSAQRSWALMKLPESFPTPRNRRYHDAVRRSFAVVSELIEERRRHPGKYTDVLAMLLEARDPETGEAMSDRQPLDESSTLLLVARRILQHGRATLISRLPEALDNASEFISP